MDKKIDEASTTTELREIIELRGELIKQDPNFQLEIKRMSNERLKTMLDYSLRIFSFLSGLGIFTGSALSDGSFAFESFGALLMATSIYYLAPGFLKNYYSNFFSARKIGSDIDREM